MSTQDMSTGAGVYALRTEGDPAVLSYSLESLYCLRSFLLEQTNGEAVQLIEQ